MNGIFDSHAHYDDQRFEEDRAELLPRIHREGVEYIMTIGADLQSSRAACRIAEQYDFIYFAAGIHPEQAAEAPEDYLQALRRLAAEVIPQRVAVYSAVMGLTPAGVRITDAKKRFGSCSGQNRLCFSWRLMQYPPEAVDYVVVHELAHIRHHNHSPAFYALVARYMPDYRERQALLRV